MTDSKRKSLDEMTYEELRAYRPPFVGRRKPRAKAILAEISERMHEAVKAKPR